MKHKIIILITVISIAIIATLFLFGAQNSVQSKRQPFNRIISKTKVATEVKIDLNNKMSYVAGITSTHIYIGNHENYRQLQAIGINHYDTSSIKLQIPDRLHGLGTNIVIDSNTVMITDWGTHLSFKGNLTTGKMEKITYDSTAYFDLALPISKNSIVQRFYNPHLKKNILGKHTEYPAGYALYPNILEKMIDGVFCTDGMIAYSKESNKVVYTYFYRNQFIVMDTNLNVLNRYNTIDTFRTPQIRVSEIENQQKTTLSSPPATINKAFCISNNIIVIESSLLASNEISTEHKKNFTFDVYNIEIGKYIKSFYIPKRSDHLSSFQVYNDHFIAIYDDFLELFKIDPIQSQLLSNTL